MFLSEKFCPSGRLTTVMRKIRTSFDFPKFSQAESSHNRKTLATHNAVQAGE